MTPEVRFERVTFAYSAESVALTDVDLVIPAGQRVAIVGHNGSGKSTLLRHLNGLARPVRGRVLHQGSDIANIRVSALARTVGLLFQDPDLQVFEERVDDEVAFGPRNLGWPESRVQPAVERAISQVGLDAVREANPFTMGFSKRKLVALASVIAMETPIVALDEPTTGQDARGVDRVAGVVHELAEAGRTVIAASHDMRFVAETFERIVVLAGGRVQLDGPPEDVFGLASRARLGQARVDPPPAALAGEAFGLGSTPREEQFIRALSGRR